MSHGDEDYVALNDISRGTNMFLIPDKSVLQESKCFSIFFILPDFSRAVKIRVTLRVKTS